MISKSLILAAGLAMVGLASAQCGMEKNEDSFPNTDPYCIGQGEGDYQFVMWVNEVDVPTLDGDNPNAGNVAATRFIIYDNACNIKGVFEKPDGNSCGLPFVIEDPSLTYVLSITDINTDVGNPFYRFSYADGEFSIGNNQCACFDVTEGLQAEKACRCSFPVDGL